MKKSQKIMGGRLKLGQLSKKKWMFVGGGVVLTAAIAVAIAVPLSLKKTSHAIQTKDQAYSDLTKPINTAAQWNSYLTKWQVYLQDFEGFRVADAKEIVDKARFGVTINDALAIVNEMAFFGANMPRGFMLPQKTFSISSEAFRFATFDAEFVLPDTIEAIKDNAFADAVLPPQFRIPLNLKEAGEHVFRNADISNGIVLPEGIPAICDFLFEGASMPFNFKIPASVLKIGEFAFANANVTPGFMIPSSVLEIKANAFESALLTPGYAWFVNAAQIAQPAPGATLGLFDARVAVDAFRMDDYLTSKANELSSSFALGATTEAELGIAPKLLPGMTSTYSVIDNYVVGRLSVNITIMLNGISKTKQFTVFGFRNQLTKAETLLHLKGMKTSTQNQIIAYADEWAKYLVKYESYSSLVAKGLSERYVNAFKNDITVVPELAFSDNSNKLLIPNGFKLPDSVDEIKSKAFLSAEMPVDFVLPNAIRIIGESAFMSAKFNGDLKLPENLTVIESSVFSSAFFAGKIIIPPSVKEIKDDAFRTSLNEGFNVPSSVSAISDEAFRFAVLPVGCSWVNDVTNQVVVNPVSGTSTTVKLTPKP